MLEEVIERLSEIVRSWRGLDDPESSDDCLSEFAAWERRWLGEFVAVILARKSQCFVPDEEGEPLEVEADCLSELKAQEKVWLLVSRWLASATGPA